MLTISTGADGALQLDGRFDASQVEHGKAVFLALSGPAVVDCTNLEYISSAGLGVLLAAQKKLMRDGHGLKLVHVGAHILDVLHFSGFDQVFEIE